MLRKSDSLLKSQAILSMVEYQANDNEKITGDFTVECYQNGREQGYQIVNFGIPMKSIYFSEQRNSDQIVVYVGSSSCQGVSEDAYKNSRCFFTIEDTVKYIIDVLISIAKK